MLLNHRVALGSIFRKERRKEGKKVRGKREKMRY